MTTPTKENSERTDAGTDERTNARPGTDDFQHLIAFRGQQLYGPRSTSIYYNIGRCPDWHHTVNMSRSSLATMLPKEQVAKTEDLARH